MSEDKVSSRLACHDSQRSVAPELLLLVLLLLLLLLKLFYQRGDINKSLYIL